MNLKHATKLITAAFFIQTTMGTILHACTITLINDTQNMVLVALKNPKPKKKPQKSQTPKVPQRQGQPQKLWVKPGTEITFGDDTQHTCFDISLPAMPDKSKRSQEPMTYQRLCTISQHSCTMGKKVELKVSDIPERVDRSLFTVTVPKKRP